MNSCLANSGPLVEWIHARQHEIKQRGCLSALLVTIHQMYWKYTHTQYQSRQPPPASRSISRYLAYKTISHNSMEKTQGCQILGTVPADGLNCGCHHRTNDDDEGAHFIKRTKV